MRVAPAHVSRVIYRHRQKLLSSRSRTVVFVPFVPPSSQPHFTVIVLITCTGTHSSTQTHVLMIRLRVNQGSITFLTSRRTKRSCRPRNSLITIQHPPHSTERGNDFSPQTPNGGKCRNGPLTAIDALISALGGSKPSLNW